MVFTESTNLKHTLTFGVTLYDADSFGKSKTLTDMMQTFIQKDFSNTTKHFFTLKADHSTSLQISVMTKCSSGFFGINCDCAGDRNQCEHGICNKVNNRNNCVCVPGYTGNACNVDINDCSSNPCNHGTCNDHVNGFDCSCPAGYLGKTCETNINDCIVNPCVHGTCHDEVNDFSCSCEAGFKGKTCNVDIDECSSNPCQHGTCYDHINGFTCSCDLGYSGKTCDEDINDCSPNLCHHGTCNDQVHGFTCSCDPGFSGKTCNVDINDCSPNLCQNGTCNDQVHGFTCSCDPGFSGKTCNVDIDDCSPNLCHHGTCNDQVHAFTCSCDPGFSGKTCNVDIDDCSPNLCQHGTCNDQLNGFTCSCDQGFSGKTCNVDIDDCSSNPCQHGTCHDQVNGFICSCEPGYTGKSCSEDIDECNPNPCYHGTCSDQLNGFSCSCEVGYSGKTCSTIFNTPTMHISSNGKTTMNYDVESTEPSYPVVSTIKMNSNDLFPTASEHLTKPSTNQHKTSETSLAGSKTTGVKSETRFQTTMQRSKAPFVTTQTKYKTTMQQKPTTSLTTERRQITTEGKTTTPFITSKTVHSAITQRGRNTKLVSASTILDTTISRSSLASMLQSTVQRKPDISKTHVASYVTTVQKESNISEIISTDSIYTAEIKSTIAITSVDTQTLTEQQNVTSISIPQTTVTKPYSATITYQRTLLSSYTVPLTTTERQPTTGITSTSSESAQTRTERQQTAGITSGVAKIHGKPTNISASTETPPTTPMTTKTTIQRRQTNTRPQTTVSGTPTMSFRTMDIQHTSNQHTLTATSELPVPSTHISDTSPPSHEFSTMKESKNTPFTAKTGVVTTNENIPIVKTSAINDLKSTVKPNRSVFLLKGNVKRHEHNLTTIVAKLIRTSLKDKNADVDVVITTEILKGEKNEVVSQVSYIISHNGVGLSEDKAKQYFKQAVQVLHLQQYSGSVQKIGSDASEKSWSDIHLGLIVGIAAANVVLFLFVIGLFVCIRKRRAKLNTRPTITYTDTEEKSDKDDFYVTKENPCYDEEDEDATESFYNPTYDSRPVKQDNGKLNFYHYY